MQQVGNKNTHVLSSCVVSHLAMNFSIEQKVTCCSWAIAYEYEAIRRFQRTYPGVVPPTRKSVNKWKANLLKLDQLKEATIDLLT